MVDVLSVVVRLMVALVAVQEMTPALFVTAMVPELATEYQPLEPIETDMATARESVELKSPRKGTML